MNFLLYIKESYNELLHNVTWPTWSELFSHAKLVLIATVIFSLVVYVLDIFSNGFLQTLYKL